MVKTKNVKVERFKGDSLSKIIYSTGIYPLDFILNGGIRESESYQFISESGVGKTTIALQLARNFCSNDKKVVYVDSECSLETDLLESVGIYKYYEAGSFIYVRESVFSTLEHKLDDLLSSDDMDISLIIIDSIAALVPEDLAKTEKGMSITTKDTNSSSRQLTLFLNKYKTLSAQKKFSIILINQYRNEIDMKRGAVLKAFGPKNVKYNSDVIIQIKNNTKCYDFKDIVGKLDNMTDLVLEVVKSNKNPPKEYIPICFIYGKGISTYVTYLYAMLKLNIITQTGSWYKIPFNGEQHVSHGINDLLFKFYQYNIVTDEIAEQIDAYYEKNFRSLSICDRM